MKKTVMLLALLASVTAQAEWISYQHGAEADELYESKPVSRDGDVIKLWTLTNFAKTMTSLEGKDYQSERMLTTVDCAKKKMGAEQVIRHAGKSGHGEVVSAMETPLRLVSVKPGSTDDALLAKLCH